MITPVDIQPANDRDLVLAFLMDASPAALFRCWTEPKLLEQWFAPKPLTTAVKRQELKVGGVSEIVMTGPDGTIYPANGVYLEIVPDKKLTFTDAFGEGWVPSAKPFFCGEISFTPRDGKTLYVAHARHWTTEDAEAHANMGFHQGWTQCAGQLAELAATL